MRSPGCERPRIQRRVRQPRRSYNENRIGSSWMGRGAVTIYVSPGVFSRNSYVIRPGHTVRTGPVREPGSWAFWTEPTACHEEPRGVLLAGPGVSVEQEFYASAPGVR